MSAALRLARIHARDVLRGRWLIVYALGFALLTEGFLRFSGSESNALLGLGTVTLIAVPMLTLVVATVHLYAARDFVEMLLAQPVRRGALFAGLYLGLALPAAGAFLVGAGAPLAVRGFLAPLLRGACATLLISGVLLTTTFVAVACCVVFLVEDRLRGLGVALGVWGLAAVLYDAGVLMLVALASDHPLEKPLLLLTFANPIDLARVLLLLRLDAAGLMGYTGAAFQTFFGGWGAGLALAALMGWVALPVLVGARAFNRKDF
jgi:Cu-processing system permease protein